MELLKLYIEILRDSSVPENRVVRKCAAVVLASVGLLAYYRHVVLQFGFGEAALVTLGLSLIFMFIVGILGGTLAGSFYGAFLKDVGALKREPTIAVFFAEWLFAATAPLLGGIMFGFVQSDGGYY